MANNSRLNLAAKCGDTDRKAVVTGRAIPRSTGQRSRSQGWWPMGPYLL